jgi:hypothetical protein
MWQRRLARFAADPPAQHFVVSFVKFDNVAREADTTGMAFRLPLSIALGLLAFQIVTAADPALVKPPAVIKAKVQEPVLQELMGGCSLKCAFGWTVEIELPPGKPEPTPGKKSQKGKKPPAIKVLNDDNAETSWTAPEGTTGVGVKFKFVFPKKLIPELEGTPLYGLDFINGFWKTEELWKEHGRVKKARLAYNGKPFRDLSFADSRRWERVEFPDIEVHSGDAMTFEILEIYPGEKGEGAAISEIVLQGAH